MRNIQNINIRYGSGVPVPCDLSLVTQPKVPESFGKEYALKKGLDAPMGATKSKTYLTKAFSDGMDGALLKAIDPGDEVKGWSVKISKMLVW